MCAVFAEAALEGEHANGFIHRRVLKRRGGERHGRGAAHYLDTAFGESVVSGEVITIDADHGCAEIFGDFGEQFGVVVVSGGEDDCFCAFCGVTGFEDAGADEDAVAAQLHHERSVGRSSDAAGGEIDDGQTFEFADFEREIDGDGMLFSEGIDFVIGECAEVSDFAVHGSHMSDGFDDVASTCFTFCADHGGAFLNSSARFAQVASAADERDLELMFIDMIIFVGHGQDFGFVDIVDIEGLEDLCFDEVSDTDFSHDGDGDGIFNGFDQRGIAHAGDAAFFTDIGGDSFQRHNGDGTRFLCNFRLFGVDDVHNDAAFEHLS